MASTFPFMGLVDAVHASSPFFKELDVTSKIPNTSQGTTPERGRLKAPRKPTIPAIRAFIAEQGRVTVYAGKEYATAFRAPPLDGNVYIVEE